MDPHPRIWSYKQNLSKNLCYTHFRALLLVENFEQPIGKLKNERSIILRWKYLYNVHAMFRTSTKLVPNKYQTCSILDFSFHCHPSSATRPCSRPFRLMTSFDDRRKKWSSRPNRFRNRKQEDRLEGESVEKNCQKVQKLFSRPQELISYFLVGRLRSNVTSKFFTSSNLSILIQLNQVVDRESTRGTLE